MNPWLILLAVVILLYLLQMYVPVVFNFLLILVMAFALMGIFGHSLSVPIH